VRDAGGVLVAGFGSGGTTRRWYSSANAAGDWTALPAGQPEAESTDHHGLWFADAQRGLSIGSDGRVRATSDGGRSWVHPSNASGPAPVARLFAPHRHFAPGGVVWRLNGQQLERTADGGASWQAAALPEGAAATAAGPQFVDASHGWLAAASCSNPVAVVFCSTLYRTVDSGGRWEAISELQAVGPIAFADTDTGVLMRFDDDSLHRTTDGGRTWSALGLPRGSIPLARLIYFRNAQEGWLLPGREADPRLMKTLDAGRTWTLAATLPAGLTLWDIAFADALHGWIVGDRGLVLHTRDGGASWQRQESGTERPLNSVVAIDADTAWITGSIGTLLVTRSGGS
jgi:photosystem II stability/assembly factor-like uncharacterized protein